MESKIAAIWARVSDPKQEDPSLDTQVERARVKLESEGYIVNHVLKRVWTSTDLKPCPEFQQLVRLVLSKAIQAVGMLDRDRIEADGLQRLIFLGECKEHGVRPIVCQGPPFLEGTEGQLVELALAMGKDKSNFRAQTGAKQGLEDRAKGRSKKNNFQEMPPTKAKVYGMQWRDGMYRPDENYDNACLIFRLWFEQRNKGYIARELFKRGIPSSSGNRIWDPSSLGAILTNPIYTGVVATLKYERVEPKKRGKTTTFGKSSARLKPEEEWHWMSGERVEKPIITCEQRLDIKRMLAMNQINAKRNNQHEDLARGIIECMLCHRKYYAVQPSSGGRRRYVCSNHHAQPAYAKKCPAEPLDCEEIDTGLKARIRQFLEKPEVYRAEAEVQVGSPEVTKRDIEQTIGDLTRQHKRTIDDERRLANILTPEAFKEEQALLVARRTWLADEIKQQKAKLTNLEKYSLSKYTIEAMRDRLQHNLDNATFEDWCLIRDALGAKIMSFGDGTWDIEVNIPVTDELIVNKTPWCIHR